MDYQKIHDQIIERAKTRQLEGYRERHHIIPKCMGGNDDVTNLVYLTAREHFVVHKILCKIFPEVKGLRLAVWLFVNKIQSRTQQRNYQVSSKEYEQAKYDMIDCLLNRKISKETREKMSKTRKGKRFSSEHKKQMSLSMKGKKKSVVHYKFTYNDYLQIYNDFIEINKKNLYIGIEKYCNNTKQISSTTFRKFIKDNNLFCPRAKRSVKIL